MPWTSVDTSTTKNTASKIVSLPGTPSAWGNVASTIGTAPRRPAQPPLDAVPVHGLLHREPASWPIVGVVVDGACAHTRGTWNNLRHGRRRVRLACRGGDDRLSLATDLGTGQPLDHALRTCWLSLRCGRGARARRDRPVRACTTWRCCASSAARPTPRSPPSLAGGDDLAFNATMAPILKAAAGEGMRYFVRHLAEDLPAHRRAGRIAGRSAIRAGPTAACRDIARSPPASARRLGLGRRRVRRPRARLRALGRQGSPRRAGRRGGAGGGQGRRRRPRCRAVSRRRYGWPAARRRARRSRRGHGYDPAVVDALSADGERWLAELGDDPCAAVLDAEPAPVTIQRPTSTRR